MPARLRLILRAGFARGRWELKASQDGLNAWPATRVAAFSTPTRYPSRWQSLKETSTYYLLAWRPETTSNAARNSVGLK
jgi:hypothetical protein